MFRNRFQSVIAATILAGLLVGAGQELPAETITPTTTAISTDFNTLDPSHWYVSDGWRNFDQQNCVWSKRAIGIVPGQGLAIRYLPPGPGSDSALCGEVQSKRWFLYGTFEARVRTEGGSGLNSAFFAYTGPVQNQPHDEIDFEVLTREPGLVWLNRYVSGKDFGDGQRYHFDPTGNDGFHDFAFVWAPDSLRWYVDGKLAREVTTHIPTHPMKVYFSHWGSGSYPSWMGPFMMPDAPVTMTVSRFSYTPLGQNCAFAGSITCPSP